MTFAVVIASNSDSMRLNLGVNFSFVALSTEELWVRKDKMPDLYIVHGFWPESEKFDSSKQGYHMKGHLKRNRMTKNSAS